MTSLLSMMMIRIVLVVGMEAAEDNGSRRKSKSGCRLASEEAKYFIIIIITIIFIIVIIITMPMAMRILNIIIVIIIIFVADFMVGNFIAITILVRHLVI